jgi:hypothetical protein
VRTGIGKVIGWHSFMQDSGSLATSAKKLDLHTPVAFPMKLCHLLVGNPVKKGCAESHETEEGSSARDSRPHGTQNS